MKLKIIICPKCDGEGENCNVCDEQQGIIEFPEIVEIEGANLFNAESSYSKNEEFTSDPD